VLPLFPPPPPPPPHSCCMCKFPIWHPAFRLQSCTSWSGSCSLAPRAKNRILLAHAAARNQVCARKRVLSAMPALCVTCWQFSLAKGARPVRMSYNKPECRETTRALDSMIYGHKTHMIHGDKTQRNHPRVEFTGAIPEQSYAPPRWPFVLTMTLLTSQSSQLSTNTPPPSMVPYVLWKCEGTALVVWSE
jgi:hypothetical protein